MPYNNLLKKVIKDSKLTNKYISEECQKKGLKLTPSYLSKIINNVLPAPSEETTRAIAEICNVDPKILVIEAYLDRAPEELKELLNTIKFYSFLITKELYVNDIPDEVIESHREEISQLPLTNYLYEVINNFENTKKIINGLMLKGQDMGYAVNIGLNLKEPLSIPVIDSAMEPFIHKDSKVCFEFKMKYNNGEIVAVKVKEDIIIRNIFLKEDKIVLTPNNNKYETLELNVDDAIIIGKVSKIITDI